MWFCPDAPIQHRVPRDRSSPGAVLQNAFGRGRNDFWKEVLASTGDLSSAPRIGPRSRPGLPRGEPRYARDSAWVGSGSSAAQLRWSGRAERRGGPAARSRRCGLAGTERDCTAGSAGSRSWCAACCCGSPLGSSRAGPITPIGRVSPTSGRVPRPRERAPHATAPTAVGMRTPQTRPSASPVGERRPRADEGDGGEDLPNTSPPLPRTPGLEMSHSMPKASAGAPPLERMAISKGASVGQSEPIRELHPRRDDETETGGQAAQRPHLVREPHRLDPQVRWESIDGMTQVMAGFRDPRSILGCVQRQRQGSAGRGEHIDVHPRHGHLLEPFGQDHPQRRGWNTDACQGLVQVDVDRSRSEPNSASNAASLPRWSRDRVARTPDPSGPPPPLPPPDPERAGRCPNSHGPHPPR